MDDKTTNVLNALNELYVAKENKDNALLSFEALQEKLSHYSDAELVFALDKLRKLGCIRPVNFGSHHGADNNRYFMVELMS